MLDAIRTIARRAPGARYVYGSVRFYYEGMRLRRRPAEEIFTDMFRRSPRSAAAGRAADPGQSARLIKALPPLLEELRVTRIADVACGDFAWMRQVLPPEGIEYFGADIVKELVARNKQYETDHIRFAALDLLHERLPSADMVLCRDCLVYFSYRDVWQALQNIVDSGSKYLLTTTYPARKRNHDIATGQWRPLNLQAAPFNLPIPAQILVEGCTAANGKQKDKSLGLWEIGQIRAVLSRRAEPESHTAGSPAGRGAQRQPTTRRTIAPKPVRYRSARRGGAREQEQTAWSDPDLTPHRGSGPALAAWAALDPVMPGSQARDRAGK